MLALSLLAAVAIGGWAWQCYQRFADTQIALAGGERILVVERGDGFRDILGKLRGLGVHQGHDLEWKALAHEMQVVSRLQVGEYAIGHGITPRELLRKLESGRVIQYRFTLVEGWNWRELRAALARDEVLRQTLPGMDDAAVMAALGRPGQHPEGRFLPETYHYARGMSDLDLLRRAMLAMDRALAEAWDSRDADLPVETPEQLLILASIVEKETGKAEERPQIAGVFARRLKLGMKLQTDPTVIYGMGSAYDGNIRRRDLVTDTPYNTYTRTGLPPTPIAMPGRDALMASARPADGDALYFVSRNDGSHVFSATLREHNRAVDCYQRRRCR
ncbi:endolytic transglycosylase MltG [Arenimonas fontis]|uniref:Endolytic murein transglycosylase n=1 Tax=Arenimonas fontis TaxID=2608255 RepID=A0A5B2ZCJ4_9GAMM|nr:endolytic transglycosylase MltG [Arenimonas fontis]KAA2285856.1 endolytic transglycosylase MltG [Arenimonas fontis]